MAHKGFNSSDFLIWLGFGPVFSGSEFTQFYEKLRNGFLPTLYVNITQPVFFF